MVKLDLQFHAELLNVTNLAPADPDFNWSFKVKCNSCNEETPNFITISAEDSNKISGSRGEANFVMRCKFCGRESSASIEGQPKPYTADDSGSFVSILTLECRGLEPVDFEPRDGWVAEGAESQTPFEVDLSEGEWYDYDEKAGEVSITDIQFKITRA
ncbi:hypothetical protein GGI12_000808 [Dipsacomyces acuminosporus]|nr:hypothetical protein GGI12_000808 [Dipsacomyces acuminosporus]